MTSFLHTMVRITDPEKSRAFYEALGFTFESEMDIVRGGEKEATNYFFGVPGQEEELEFTLNHDGRSYELGTAYGHVAFSVDDIDEALKIAARHGCYPLRGVATYRDVYKLTYVRAPSDILVMLAEKLHAN